jgi:hypothetical protein
VKYEPNLLVPWLSPIWQATDFACGRRLVAMLPEWIMACGFVLAPTRNRQTAHGTAVSCPLT